MRAITFEAARKAFVAKYCKVRNKSWQEQERQLRRLGEKWDHRPLNQITKRHVAKVLDNFTANGKPVAANRTHALLKTFFAWSCDRDIVDLNPATAIRKQHPERSRDRVLNSSELAAIWATCDHLGRYGRIVRLLILTGQRRGEIAALDWSSVSNELLEFADTKNGKPHRIPLTDQARAIVGKHVGNARFVFGSEQRRGGQKTESLYGNWTGAKRTLDRRSGVTGWHLHDIRRTVATRLAEHGTPRVVIAALLNHSDSSVTARYDRHDYRPEVREALEWWSRKIAGNANHLDSNGR